MRRDHDSIHRPVFLYSRYDPPTDEYVTRLVGCVGIAVFFTGLIWLYGMMYHPDEVWLPSVNAASAEAQHVSTSIRPLIAPVAPAPDMHAPAIRYANADVGHQPNGDHPSGHPATVAQDAVAHAAPPKPRHVRTAKRLSPAAANSYAAAPRYYSRPEIGNAGGF